jgi:head-tail adaptor
MFLRREHLAALVVAVSLATSAQPSRAQWSVNGVPLCTAVNRQSSPEIVTDGSGGAFVAWVDTRDNPSTYHIYAQHVLASGAVDPAWTAANGNANGTPLCTAVGGGNYPTIVTDGSGGAIVTWQDNRPDGATSEIYAQHVLASGAVDPAWPADGRGLCTAVGPQFYPTIVTDGSGGAVVTWQDGRTNWPNTDNYHIYAQHVLASGAVDPTWPVDGCGLTSGGQSYPMIVTDGSGGAIVTWTNYLGAGIYAQHLLASGIVDSVWTAANGNAGGTPLCTASGKQYAPTIVTDGAHGAIVTWTDLRVIFPNAEDIYAQHVLASGAVDPAWTADGTPLCTAVAGQSYPTIVTDGVGGAIVTWQDERSYSTTSSILPYAQHVLASGGVDPAWPADGRGLTTVRGGYAPTIVTDAAGGAIVTWADNYDIYAQHVLASGAVDPAWSVDGRVLCTAVGRASVPTIATDMAGGAIVTWQDDRTGTVNGDDIYAQRIYANGGVSAVAAGAPSYSFAVRTPHPNPTNSQATVSFDLASPQPVSARVYDVTGRLVRTLAAGGELPTGSHSLIWNGVSDSGALAHSGIYFIRVNAGSAVQTREVAILR